MNQSVQPARIWEIGEDMNEWFAMLAGIQLDLFTPLDGGPLAATELASTLDVDPDKLNLLLYVLVLSGLLTIDDGRFANTEEAATFLVRGKPDYMGNAHSTWRRS